MLPRWRRGVRQAIGLIVRRPETIRQDADDELDYLLEARTADLIARGVAPDAARTEAVRRLGGSVEGARERVRQSAARRERRVAAHEWVQGLGSDLRYAARGLLREPLFAGFAVLTLALGIGANAAMFAVVDKLLLGGPAHVHEPERVARLYWTMRRPGGELGTSAAFDPRVYANLLAEARAFDGLAMQTRAGRSTLLGDAGSARLVLSSRATANLMSVLGARPALGRFFVPDEQDADAPQRVVVLGHGLWQSDFGADPNIVGRTVAISARPYTVVGVAPTGFTGAGLDRVDVWFPLPVKTGPAARVWIRGQHSAGPMIVARVRRGASFDDAARDATHAYRLTYTGDEPRYAEASISAGPLHFGRDGTESTEARIARWLAGVAVIVLLVACANIVNLLLARAVRGRREFAVRLALGAGRARLVRLLLAHSLLLATLGAAAGLLVAVAVGTVVQRVLLPDVDWSSGLVDGRVLAFSFAVAIVTGLVIGLLPALRAGRADIVSQLKAGAREGGGRRSVVRNTLMVTQAGLATVLLVGAGLFVRSLHRVQALDLGVEPDRVVVLEPRWASMPETASEPERIREAQRREDFAREILEQVARMPGVEHAAAAVGMSFGSNFAVTLRLPGRDSLPRLAGPFSDPSVSAVSADYFATVGTNLLRGRLFTPADRAGSEPVAVVSETMARVLWPDADALGECLLIGQATNCTRVVGVVEDARRRGIREDPVMHYYLPLSQQSALSGPQLLVRPRGEAEAAIPTLRARLREIDPTLLFVDAATLQDRVDPQMRSWMVGAMMFSLFGVLALVVASVGTFSLVAYILEQRRHELGVRAALGARARHLVLLLLQGAVGATGIGVLAGAVLALVAGKFAEPLLFETSARDPMVLGGVAALLMVMALLASMIPALRVRRIDPITALRNE